MRARRRICIPLVCALLTWAALPAPVAAQRGAHGSGGYRSSGGSHYSSGHHSSGGYHAHRYSAAPRYHAPSHHASSYHAPSHRASSYHPPYRAPRYHAPSHPHSTHSTHLPHSSHSSHHEAGASHSRIHRSAAAKDAFMRSTGHPHGWPGHVVDHRVPLACGGADSPSNMQWQTTAEAKAKDRVERRGCRR